MYYSIRTIVVGVGEIDAPDPMLLSALALAERTRAELHAVHAFELPPLLWDSYVEGGGAGGIQEEVARAHVEAMAGIVRELAPGRKVHCHAVMGTPASAVSRVALQQRADLVVIGAATAGALSRQILGTTAQRVLRHAPAPVLVLRGGLPERLDRVLLTTDLSPLSATVHEVGLDVLDSLPLPGVPEVASLLTVTAPTVLPPPLSAAAVEHRGRDRLREFLELRRPREGTVHPRVRVGSPATEIALEAQTWNADLVVLGTHSRTGVDRLWLGSVAEAVLRDLRCAALVVPVAAADRLYLPARRQEMAVVG
jgi:nucleotide-binding universal stress UspA family protein